MTDENEMFKIAMGDVKPITNKSNNVIHKKLATDSEKARLRRQAAVFEENEKLEQLTLDAVEMVPSDDPIFYKKPGVQDGVYRNLRLGKYELHSVLNLHGCTVAQARTELLKFIGDCERHNLRSVLIQHGKGVKSLPHKAIIKSYLYQWLQNLKPVLAFHSAQPQHGGNGAVYVLFKKSEQASLMNRERHQKRSAV